MSRFVRASKYRHVFGQPGKKEYAYENVKVTSSAWDTNMVAVSSVRLHPSLSLLSSFLLHTLTQPAIHLHKLALLRRRCIRHLAPPLTIHISLLTNRLPLPLQT